MNRKAHYAATFALLIILFTLTRTARAESLSWVNLSSFASSESALMLCTPNLLVTSNGDSGPGSLRQAVFDACPGSTITFADTVVGAIPVFGQIVIDKNLVIQGPGAGRLNVQNHQTAGPNSRIFHVTSGVTATISGLRISNGDLLNADGGAGIHNAGNLTVTNSIVEGNRVSGVDGVGGGIYSANATLTVINTTVNGNSAVRGGGILSWGTLNLTNSSVVNNVGVQQGGGLYHFGDSATITNTTISGNRTLDGLSRLVISGAGIYGRSGTVTLTNSTIAYNAAVDNEYIKGIGGGIYVEGATVSSRNSIIAANTAQQGPDIRWTLNSQGYNLIGNTSGADIGGSTIGNIVNTNAQLGGLGNYGGPTPTHALLAGSPAINAADTVNAPSADQRGAPRVGSADMGAFEFNGIAPNTLTGYNVTAQTPSGDARVTFSQVTAAGTTTFTPITPPSSAGTPPAGYTILNEGPAYNITTTAIYTPPVTVCFTVASITDAGTFASVRILHGEYGQLVDRTLLAPDALAPDFGTRRICARVDSLSPFVAALGPNTAPLAANDFTSVVEWDTRLVSAPGILANDTDSENDPLTATLVSSTTNGTLNFYPNGMFIYDPNDHFNGTDSFTYTASDGDLSSNIATVTITVTEWNDSPSANEDYKTTDEDTTLVFSASDLTANDSPGANESNQTLTVTTLNPPEYGMNSNGTVSLSNGLITYQPNNNYNGVALILYRVCDNGMTEGWPDSKCAIAGINVTVNPVTDAPTANPGSISTNEDTPSAPFALTGIEAENGALTFQVVTQPIKGTYSQATGVYTPNANANGSDSFTFIARDAVLPSAPATVSITITPVNDAPSINSSAPTTATEDTLYTYNATVNDPDGPGQTWSFSGTHTCEGSLNSSTGVFTFTPAGPVPPASCVLAIQVADGAPGLTAAQSTTVTINAVNDAPVINSAAPSTATEDTLYTYNATRSDPDSSGQTWSLLGSHTCGGSIDSSTGTITFTPLGPVPAASCVLAVQVADNGSPSLINNQTSTVTMTAVNDAPTATAQSVTTAEDNAQAITLSGSDPDGAATPLTYTIVAQPEHGTLSGSGSNRTYTPAANYNGPDSFAFRVDDGALASGTATVSITVTAVNDTPTSNAQSVNTDEDTPKSITLSGGDIDGDALTYAVVTAPAHGTFADGVYTSALNYYGPDSFTFKANDGTADSAEATVSITINAVNDAPTANAQSVSTNEDTSKAIVFSGSDVEGDALTYMAVTGPAHGTFLNGVYTPALNYYGPDSFTFKANDGNLSSAPATVSITVISVNDAPGFVSIAPATQTVDYSDAIAPIAITVNDSDNTAGSLVVTPIASLPTGLTLAQSFGTGNWTISGIANVAAGIYTINLRVTDSENAAGAGNQITITVTKEKTATDYTGDFDLMTAGPAITTATVRLAAKLTQDDDGSPGDLTMATVRFQIFRFNATTPSFTIPNVPVDADGNAQIFYNLPSDVYTIRVELDGGTSYWTVDAINDGMLNITVPTNEVRSSGGGWIPDATSANGKAHFAFSVTATKNGQAKGNVSFSFKGSDGFNYLIKSNSWQNGYLQFSAEPNVAPAVYTRSNMKGSCTVQKIDRATGNVVASFGGYTFEVFTRDGGLLSPRQNDSYSIIVRSNTSAVFHQVGTQNSLVTLGGGNINNKAR